MPSDALIYKRAAHLAFIDSVTDSLFSHRFTFLFGRSKHSLGRAAPIIEYFLPVSRSRIINAIRCLKSATDSCCLIGRFIAPTSAVDLAALLA